MKIKKNILKIFLAIVILIVAILTGLYISHKRPLYETKEYSVTVNKAGKSYKGTVYKMLFRPNVLFLHTEIDNICYKWFTIDLNNKYIGIGRHPRRQPYLSFNADMELGVSIEDKIKVGDGWTSSWENNIIKFSNNKITITVIKGSKEQIAKTIATEMQKASKSFKNENYSIAEFHFKTVVKLKPDFAECWSGLGMCLAKQEKNNEAKRAFEKALSIHQKRYKQSPKDHNELWQQVIVLIFLNRKSEADKILKIGINKFPNQPEFKEPIKKIIDVRAF
jgi:tetratricopeptide (TPR) repeat protein